MFPTAPVPSSTHAPIIVDPSLRFEVDSGVSIRRPRYSRPRRIFQLDYLGLTTSDMRIIRDFLIFHRLSVTPFEWVHAQYDNAEVTNTTPVFINFVHPYVTGNWVWITNSTPNTGLNGIRQVTRIGFNSLRLDGTTAGGAGVCTVAAYLPRAIGDFREGTFDEPAKLMGPDSTTTTRGRFNLVIRIEELF